MLFQCKFVRLAFFALEYAILAYAVLEYRLLDMGKAIYSNDQKHLIERLKQARIDAGLDQSQAANALEKSQSYVSKIESGQRKIDVVTLKQFATIYKKAVSYFISET